MQLRSEPEAAALQHATARRIASGETVAVYDLGGGTFDVAVLRRDGEGFTLLGEPEGIEQLGGIDFDEAVFGHVLGVLGNKAEGLDPTDPEAVAALTRLRRDCIEAKEALSFDTETMIPVALPGLHTRVRLNRSELESMIAPSLADTVTATQRALRAAGVTPEQLSAILLAGGSSRIPLVAQLLSTEFQRPVVADPHPEHSIAMGAAVATAAVLGGGSPFAAAAPPPRPSAGASASASPAATRVDVPAGGLAAANTPRRGGAAAAAATAAPPVIGGAPIVSGAPATPVVPAPTPTPISPAPGPVAYSRGSAAIPGTAAAPVAPTRGPAPFVGTPGVPNVPANGFPGVPAPAPGGPQPPGGGIPWPPPAAPEDGRRGRTLMIVAAAAVAVAVAAGGTTAYLYVSHRNDDKKTTGAGVTPPASAPASAAATEPAQAFPADTMLMRVDTGAETGTGRKSKVYFFTPGKEARTELPGTEVGDVLPKWSHDRKQIAVTHVEPGGKTSSILIMNADGSNRHTVIDDAGGRVAWSADDTKIAFMKKANNINQIFVLDLTNGNLRQLTHSSTVKDDAMWAPDGKTILYWLEKNDNKLIYELNVANPQEPGRRITGPDVGPANDPVYSPDSSQILFTREIPGAKGDIWLVNRDGSDPRRLTTNPALEMDPTWSPDGKWFAFVRGDYGHPSIVIQNVADGQEVTLTKNGAREAHPCWF